MEIVIKTIFCKTKVGLVGWFLDCKLEPEFYKGLKVKYEGYGCLRQVDNDGVFKRLLKQPGHERLFKGKFSFNGLITKNDEIIIEDLTIQPVIANNNFKTRYKQPVKKLQRLLGNEPLKGLGYTTVFYQSKPNIPPQALEFL